MNRIRAGLVGVGLCTSLVATVNYAAYGQADQPSSATVVEASDIPESYVPPRYPSGESGIGLVEVADEVRERAVELLGERYVELWMAPSQEWLEVGVHDLRAGEAEKIEAELAELAPVTVVDRDLSRSELDRAEKSVKRSLGFDSDVWTDYYRQVVKVRVTEKSAARAEAAVAGLHYEVVDAESVSESSAARTSSGKPLVALLESDRVEVKETQSSLPYRAGKRLGVPGGICTSAFVVNGAAGKYGLTAGHCGPNGGWVSLGGNNLGRVENNSYYSSMNNVADAAVFHLGANPSNASVFRGTGPRPVVGQAAPIQNLAVCVRGSISANETCGTITDLNLTVSFVGGHTVSGLFSTNWGSGGTVGGDSGSPVYAVNPDGTAIALGILNAGTEHDDVNTPIGTALAVTGTSLSATFGRQPFGALDILSGGPGVVRVAGWAIDPDAAQTPTQIHVYIGGPAGSGAPGYGIAANHYRPDVASVHPGTGTMHGFDSTLSTSYRGAVPVHVYAINLGTVPAGHTVWSGIVNIS